MGFVIVWPCMTQSAVRNQFREYGGANLAYRAAAACHLHFIMRDGGGGFNVPP